MVAPAAAILALPAATRRMADGTAVRVVANGGQGASEAVAVFGPGALQAGAGLVFDRHQTDERGGLFNVPKVFGNRTGR